MSGPYYHGGKAGLDVGDLVVPSPPHVEDGCAICVARAAGRRFTVADARAWALQLGGERGRVMLDFLKGAPANGIIDPPTDSVAVFITRQVEYAAFYASKAGHGDLYRVEPIGDLEASPADHFPSWRVPKARVVEVLRRTVILTRKERRELLRAWKKADARAARGKA